MQHTLIFLNLDCDRHFDKDGVLPAVFPIRNPFYQQILDSYQSLGLYVGTSQDVLLSRGGLSESYKEFLLKHKIEVPNVISLKESPSSDHWLKEVCESLKHYKVVDFRLAAVTPLELLLSKELKLKVGDNADHLCSLHSEFNDKRYLYELSKMLQFSFPKTQLVFPATQSLSDVGREQVYPLILKMNRSSGGGGLFKLERSDDKVWDVLQRALSTHHKNPQWLLQNYYSRQRDYYIFGTINDSVEIQGAFQLSYDKKNSSNGHHSVAMCEDLKRMTKVALEIGQQMLSSGYRGDFGIDGFVSSEEGLFPAVDLNARTDKSRLIMAAAAKFGIGPQGVNSRRLQFQGKKQKEFQAWWKRCQNLLSIDEMGRRLDGSFVYPYHMGNLFGFDENPEVYPMELSYFYGSSHKKLVNDLNEWATQIEKAFIFATNNE